jgi:hypothetical protein
MPKAGKKTARQKAIAYATEWFSKYIRERDGGVCYTCGVRGRKPSEDEGQVMDCGHLITSGKIGTKWDEDNANCQCKPCNNKHEHYPEVYTQKWISEHGQEAYDALVAKAWTVAKFTTAQIREIGEYYRIKYEAECER